MDVNALRGFITTDLSDDALQTLLDAAEADINAALGGAPLPPTVITEYLPGGLSIIRLPYQGDPTAAITVSEWPDLSYEEDLADDDVRMSTDGWWVSRLDTGTAPAGSFAVGQIKVVYTALGNQASRDRVTVALVKCDVGMDDPTVTGENIDGYGYQKAANSQWNYAKAREAILSTLTPSALSFA